MLNLTGVQVLVADDDPAQREILAVWLRLYGAEPVMAADGLEAVQALYRQHFDIVVTDLDMPNLNGHQVLAVVKETSPATQVIMLSGCATVEDAILALREGRAFDFLLKPVREFSQLNEVLVRALQRRSISEPSVRVAPPVHVEPLSNREREVVSLVAEGMDNRQIAARLVLSEKTVRNHLSRVYEKLKVNNRTKAVMDSRMYGLIS